MRQAERCLRAWAGGDEVLLLLLLVFARLGTDQKFWRAGGVEFAISGGRCDGACRQGCGFRQVRLAPSPLFGTSLTQSHD